MNIGVLTVNGFDFHPNQRFNQAARKRGHHILLINPYHVMASVINNRFNLDTENRIAKIDVMMPRQGSLMGDYGLVMLRQFKHSGIRLVNGLAGVTIARNQFITLQTLASAGIHVPNTIFITRKAAFSKAVERLGGYPVVIKQVNGMGGQGVIKADQESDSDQFLQHHLATHRGVLVQHFFPPQNRKDIRILVVGGHIAGAMQLQPRTDDFRANISQNSSARAIQPSHEQIAMAVASARACGLEIAGIDLIEPPNCAPKVIEVNYSPGFKGLEAATGMDIAGQIIDYVTNLKTKMPD